jgi:hypothetical protein
MFVREVARAATVAMQASRKLLKSPGPCTRFFFFFFLLFFILSFPSSTLSTSLLESCSGSGSGGWLGACDQSFGRDPHAQTLTGIGTFGMNAFAIVLVYPNENPYSDSTL